MATLKDYRDERIRKLNSLREQGIDPYPAHSNRNAKIGDILDDFAKYQDQEVCIAGRIASIRSFGKLAFVVIEDDSGKMQAFLSGDGAKATKLFDAGDFVEANGKIGLSKTEEKSIFCDELRILTKSLRPLPGRDGFTKKEERLRRRYVDMAVNPEVRERFVRRAKFWTATRDFLNQHGFVEINIPVLEHTTGGADANPFVTHMDALDQDLYLRISHELPLKRLLGGGFERVYDIGPRFRNEGMSEEHLPEHVAMEWYAAYWDAEQGRKFMEEMYKYVAQATWGTLQFEKDDFKVDFAGDWEVWDYAETIKKHYGIDVYNVDLDTLKSKLKEHNLAVEKTENIPRAIDKLWKNIRKSVGGPVWLINTPKFISPLSKSNPDGVSTQRFQPVIFGSELGNGFSELNDPLDQLARFEEQQSMRDAGDDEAMMLDMDFVEMLEYGMPPACGWGYSERVFWSLEGVSAREGVPFPPMKNLE